MLYRYFNLCTVSIVTFLKVSMLSVKRLVVSTLKVVRVLFSGHMSSLSCFSSVLFESLYSNSYIISVAERKAEQPSLLTCELFLTPSTFSSSCLPLCDLSLCIPHPLPSGFLRQEARLAGVPSASVVESCFRNLN